jgi:FKBP-type peptidyl-prolyl cis-trans isomerase FklB
MNIYLSPNRSESSIFMKFRSGLIIALSLGLGLTACQQSAQNGAKPDLSKKKDKISYSIGYNIGRNLKGQDADINPSVIARGISDAMQGDTLMSQKDMMSTLQNFQTEMMQQRQQNQEKVAKSNLEEGKKFLADNKSKPGVHETKSGLQYKILKTGKGPQPGPHDTVVTDYKGSLLNGKVFDSSYKRGKPATFPVDGVIPGWTEALQKMHVGSKWRIWIPPNLAYGKRGAGSTIQPNSTLIFDVELLNIKKSDKKK